MCITMLRILLLEFCSKYMMCTCESPFMRYHTRASAHPRSQPVDSRMIIPATLDALFFATDSILLCSLSFRDWKYARVTGYTRRVNRIIVRNRQVCDDWQFEKWGRIKISVKCLTHIRICKNTRSFIEDNVVWLDHVVGYRAID